VKAVALDVGRGVVGDKSPPCVPAPGQGPMDAVGPSIMTSSCSTTSSVLPLVAQRFERPDQPLVVARVQADGPARRAREPPERLDESCAARRIRWPAPPESVCVGVRAER